MLFDEADSELLKQWIVKKLEDVSDADSDVLADYVLALVKTDDPEPVAKASCVENLQDFLGDTSQKFVDDVFTAIKTKAYDPSKPALKAPAPTYQPPRRTSLEPPNPHTESRKRSYHDWDRDESQNGQIPSYQGGDRPVKQPRRGRGGGRGGAFEHRGGRQNQYGGAPQAAFPPMPTPPPGIPAFDPNNPVASMMAQFAAMTGMPGYPQPQAQTERCRDYDTKGFCARGAQCPFEHGNDRYVVPGNDQYDPNHAALLNVQPTRTGTVETSPGRRGRGGQRGRGGNNYRGGNKRADFSMLGQNKDKSITAVVVESIPEDKFDEQIVRDFFGEFGNIEEVTMQPYQRLAIVKYDTYDAAKAAYESPNVIFDNRFVKVYWYKPENFTKTQSATPNNGSWKQNGGDVDMQDEEPHIDPEELAKKQEEAQRKYDEHKKQLEAADKQKEELDAKMRAIEAERKKMADAIAKKAGKKAASPTPAANGSEDNEQTKALKEQLAKLEAEAMSLGIDPDAATISFDSYPSYVPRGRGGWRGRPRGRGRGGFNPSFRGGWGGARGGAVMRLDNRPKTVAVTFSEGTYNDHDEALRQWLLFNGSESATLTKHPHKQAAALVAFPERYLGENFMNAASSSNFPLAGKAELSWYTESANGSQDVKMEVTPDTNEAPAGEDQSNVREMDDIADDDHWG
ncbi:hypothetical protein M409DRAFT_59364 [Zasmidium cellare ATCC 36951]|uniref:C3H1-type domain-containing protein n=1 Tax=Zasmidium cellare ATCC 36951 TaxID=1080233 RepID=A0A6A6C2D8_ZASCE|nr:uncharacterized protein M409DRAFT_59364 [Zasmidium cellare ATCC 36951]KAF2161093.1 hypothetical protein M409DRAFT_59364 [Zasmidium cellare ATCC 36951]